MAFGVPKQNTAWTWYFRMALTSDHVSAATGKTVTVTISKDGAAFAASTNSPSEIASGWYKIALTAAETNYSTIVLHATATSCDATDERIMLDTSIVSDIATSLSTGFGVLTPGFSSSNPNNLNSYLKALASKAATVPSSMGTFNPATDSVEALNEILIEMEGSGFSTSTDSLHGIRSAFTSSIAPLISITSGSLNGRFLDDCLTLIRLHADEVVGTAKYTNDIMLRLLRSAYNLVITDLTTTSDHPILCRFNISIVPGKQTYTLPVNARQIVRVTKINDQTGHVEWEEYPGTEYTSHTSGYSIEGNTLRTISDWQQDISLQILYIPDAEVELHNGTVSEIDGTGTIVTLSGSPTVGGLDTHFNAYVGSYLRIVSADVDDHRQERIIIAYDAATRQATLNEPLNTPLPSGTVIYEIVPEVGILLQDVVCLQVAIDILASEGNQKKAALLNERLQTRMRALRLKEQNRHGRFMHRMDGDTLDNDSRGFGGVIF